MLVAEALVQKNSGVFTLAVEAVARLAEIELMGDVDLRHESLAVVANEQRVLAVRHEHGQPEACARIADQEAVEQRLPVVALVGARQILHQPPEKTAGREAVEVGLARICGRACCCTMLPAILVMPVRKPVCVLTLFFSVAPSSSVTSTSPPVICEERKV